LSLAACCFQPAQEVLTSGGTGTSAGTNGSTSSGGSGGSTGSAQPTGAAYVMIVQDLSGSMCEPVQPSAPNGGASCLSTAEAVKGYCSVCSPGDGDCTDPTDCASQLQLASSTMIAVLNLTPGSGQLYVGLASFPGTGSTTCETGSVLIPVGDAVGNIPQIVQFYQEAVPSGGAPMAATLAVAANDPAMGNPDPTVRKIILLVTDGLPNCAATSACTSEPWSNGQSYGCASPAEVAATLPSGGPMPTPPMGCSCSFGGCPETDEASCCPVTTGSTEASYCLDDQNTESEIGNLYATQNITTYVVGTGHGYATNPTVLNAMAAAGHGTLFQASAPAPLQAFLLSLIPDGGQ
jgi:hypothetical protein